MAHAKERVTGVKELTGYFRYMASQAPGKLTVTAVKAGAEVILEAAQANVRANFENQTGALEDSGKIVMVNQYAANVEFDIVYSAAHEYGLENQVITELQRKFFWAKWYETNEGMWRALALSTTYTIPARPYLRPAIDSHKSEAAHAMGKKLRHEMVKRQPKAVSIRGGGSRLKL